MKHFQLGAQRSLRPQFQHVVRAGLKDETARALVVIHQQARGDRAVRDAPHRHPIRIDVGALREQIERMPRGLNRLRPDQSARPRGFAIAGNTHARDLDSEDRREVAILHDALMRVALASVEHQHRGQPTRLGTFNQVSLDLIMIGAQRDFEVEWLDNRRMRPRRRGGSRHVRNIGRVGLPAASGKRNHERKSAHQNHAPQMSPHASQSRSPAPCGKGGVLFPLSLSIDGEGGAPRRVRWETAQTSAFVRYVESRVPFANTV